jgi:RimJ/RimL family protein N-acetyltransferase
MTTLTGQFVRLEPLAEMHREPLRAAARDERIWEFNIVSGFGPAFDGWFDAARSESANGSRIPFTVIRLSDGAVLGSTSFLDPSPLHRRVEIGHTWYHPSAWNSVVNPECKRLLFGHAFDVLDLSRVSFNVDATNLRSRAAVRKLGATEEGVLRRHAVTYTGRVRDTVVHSVLADEWPAVREGLERRLSTSPHSPDSPNRHVR